MFSVKIVWLQEVVTERDKIGRLFTNQIVKNAQELNRNPSQIETKGNRRRNLLQRYHTQRRNYN